MPVTSLVAIDLFPIAWKMASAGYCRPIFSYQSRLFFDSLQVRPEISASPVLHQLETRQPGLKAHQHDVKIQTGGPSDDLCSRVDGEYWGTTEEVPPSSHIPSWVERHVRPWQGRT